MNAITKQIKVSIIDDNQSDEDDNDYSVNERDANYDRNKENPSHNVLESTDKESTSLIKDDLSSEKSGKISRIISDYKKKLFDLLFRTEGRWMCKECPYKSSKKAHALDHAEKHIKGFTLECKFCDKTFSRKSCIRQHMGRWHKEKLRNVGRPKILRLSSTI